MKFIAPNDPILTKVAKRVPKKDFNSPKLRKIVKGMIQLISAQRRNKRPKGVGLAAPQIGVSKKIILVDTKADGKGKFGNLEVFINPEIVWKSKKAGEWYEGCFSTSKACGIVSRPISIKIQAFTSVKDAPWSRSDLNMVEKKYTGYVARIFHHEIDHLNGQRFPDLITDPKKLHWVLKKEFPIYRSRGKWKTWPKKCSFEKWKKIIKLASRKSQNPQVST